MNATATRAAPRADRATAEAGQSRVVGVLVTVGLVAYGIVHLVVTWVALQVAWGHAPTSASQQGSIGQAVVYAVVYGYLGVISLKFAVGSASSGGSRSSTAHLINNPAGRVLLRVVAAGVLAVGVGLLIKGVRKTFTVELEDGGGRALIKFGQVGYAAKGVAILIAGYLIGWATITHHPGQAGALDAAVHAINSEPYGPVLLTVLAAGIACFGLYCFGWARRARRS